MTPAPSPRIYLLTARLAPVAAILRRGPSRLWHVMRWATDTNEIEPGSWFQGRIYEERSELSWNGKYLLYFAMGKHGKTWTGVARLPWLKTLAHVEGCGTYGGGGFWLGTDRVQFHDQGPVVVEEKRLPFLIRKAPLWSRLLPQTHADYGVPPAGETFQPSKEHPRLVSQGGMGLETTRYNLIEYPNLLDRHVTCAVWDSKGQLLVGRQGFVERYRLEDFACGEPSFRLDLNDLAPPWAADLA